MQKRRMSTKAHNEKTEKKILLLFRIHLKFSANDAFVTWGMLFNCHCGQYRNYFNSIEREQNT